MPQLKIDLEDTTQFMVDLLNIPSPTGYHVEAIPFIQQAFEALNVPGLSTQTIRKGALIVKWAGKSSEKPIGLTAHTDTLGFMVKEIKSSGRLKLTKLGGILWGGVESEGVTVRTADDRRIRGSIVPENTSVHVNPGIHHADRTDANMEVRLDARTTSSEETRALGIEVGDFVFVDPRIEISESGFIRSRFLDDKAGVAAIYGAVKAISAAGITPPRDVYMLIANYEEVGHGGAAGFPDDLEELLAVDMGALGQGQTGDEFSVSICAKDASGPYHFDMVNKLRGLAQKHEIPYHVDIFVSYSSDGSAFWRSGGDAKVGVAGPGVDASHAYERTHKDSILHTTNFLAHYILTED